ncbi:MULTISPECIES: type IA DNA topoisomerase [unclassified Paenibacillus]|uniref:type IA DNA topoisomerase n=1 Tax=unclassified Paenibacillus TaxID=185978 RepID=UPI0024058108|nr:MULTISPECIES: type IA DNA topoisomerase [unclassified Paenibacillus]MDF9841103.1 DNA topoisomerase-3 [Paenibacillus sp. PastF-2]MDF9847725.1 DNA topoisomerase-3 [Paenibacillus sp. PastM-2]MDF9854294.1 DNA topoisomerase-3 [Paenibacillus sp. PastF-1]MDH6479535.1 DNA topoisomerase-3 [Paenibacillus sp. PastH-2]MDH6505200.1 DNA topoisomerase-3 [Paenibacillus sp. PastM-3]
MKTLIIAEKPDMGRNIAAAIEPKAKNYRSYLEGEQYIITWAIGHLIGLAEPEAYDGKYKKWNINDLPIIPDQFKLVPNARTIDQLKVIGELAKRSNLLVNSCDAGREGQHIFSLIQRHLKLSQPVKRLWISDLTPETIRKGFQELKDGSEYENLTKAARARSEADWLIGMNGSRAFTTKHNVLLSVGRVQTPVLALIYDRQKTIEAFSSLKFFEVEGHFTQNEVVYKGMWQGDRLTDKEKANALAAKVKGKPGRIASYEVKDTKEYPNKLYDLTLLQREANGKYAFSAKKTLDIAQALYEKHKVISYPRTNSNYVTEQNIPEMHKTLNALQGTSYDELVKGANRSLVHKGNKFVCNPSKVEDHHAILPTNRKASGLSADEAKLYDLIVRRFLSQFYPAAEYKVHTVITEVEGESFKTTVKELLSLGWKVIYADQKKDKAKPSKGKGKDEEEEEEIEVNEPFSISPADEVLCSDAVVKEKDTQPPKHYTEGTLLKAMESAGKQIEDEELRDAMKDSGLGTPATRAATIERLKNVGYVEMQGKKIAITQKGRTAIELIRGAGIELLTSPEMTGQWERRLNEIARGTAADGQFMENVKRFASMIVDKVKVQSRAAKTSFEGETPSVRSGSRGRGSGSASKDGADKPAGGTRKRSSAGDGGAGAKPAGARAAKPAEQGDGGPKIIGSCPRPGCGGTIFMGRKGYGCSHYKEGCKFVIWKETHGRTLTDTQVKALIEKGKTGKLKLAAEDGSPLEGKLVLANMDTGQLSVE